ncbi:MAG: neutral/alkaline non-lysosomal ceramidase N-terminal domain-containing protein [Cyclobacteriaceae bacterium]
MPNRQFWRTASGIIVMILVTLLLFFQRVDRIPYTEQNYFQQAQELIEEARDRYQPTQSSLLEVGWSRMNITPEQPAHLMGYGWKGDYEEVHDSLWVRTIVLQLDTLSVGIVAYDLMLTPPDVAQRVRDTLALLSIDQVYFSAIHTHHGYGSWVRGLGREVIAGRYQPHLVQQLVDQTTQALAQAQQQVLPAQVGYTEINLDSLVNNRLVKDGKVEPYLRALFFQREDSSLGVFSSFSAHATFLDHKSQQLSADYPGELLRQLELTPSVDFALFAAGAVGSHSPYQPKPFSYPSLQQYSSHLATPILEAIDQIAFDSVTQLGFSEIELPVGEPQLRIAKNWRVRPFWFRQIMGKLSPSLTFLQIGNITLVGTPGDFSGLLYEKVNADRGPVMVTSFNGEYIGYIIPSAYYRLDHRETRSINWFGPYTGDYITDIINQNLEYIRKY